MEILEVLKEELLAFSERSVVKTKSSWLRDPAEE